MEKDSMELTGSECPQCGEEKTVAVAVSSSCKECGLDSMYMKYEIPGGKIKEVLTAVFRILDTNDLQPAEGVTGIDSIEQLMKRLNP